MNKLWYIYRMEAYLTIKRNELLIWMNLKISTLSKRRQTKKSTYPIIPFIWNSRKWKLIYSDRKQISGCHRTGCGGGGRGALQRVTRKPWGLCSLSSYCSDSVTGGHIIPLNMCKSIITSQLFLHKAGPKKVLKTYLMPRLPWWSSG